MLMFFRILTWFAACASAAVALLVVAGLLAPLDPRFEMFNHFRPFLLAGAFGAFAIALVLRKRRLLAACGVPLVVLIALSLAPLLFAAPSATDAAPNLRVLSLNLWANNTRLPQTALFLRFSRADVIVLQEVLCEQSDPLFEALRAEYPHQFRASERCFGQAILSKHPIVTTGRENYKHRQPIWIWAELTVGMQIVRVTSVHLSHPTQPFDQVENVAELAHYARTVTSAHVMAGDFNLTPHSWLLSKFSWQSGMRRHGTYRASWPGHRAFPAFLIDHVFTSEGIARADFRVLPFAGSDHRPVVADLVLPRRAIAGTISRSDRDRF
jgi:vancomycin resistance protein VanJ